MKYTVKIFDKTYEVEIEDIHARPVIARVDGEQFEVVPENGTRPETGKEAGGMTQASVPTSSPVLSGNTLTSPLPGTVTEIFIKKGDRVEKGQVILIIEAMKMKNSIRSVRTGTVAELLVSAGQTVSHKQALVEFTE